MGQKIHPVGMRLGITRTWDSRWFEKKHYVEWLHEDIAIRKSFNRWMRSASISKIEIERRANQARVIVNTAKPGIIIGKRGVGIDEIRKTLEQLTGKSVAVNVSPRDEAGDHAHDACRRTRNQGAGLGASRRRRDRAHRA